MVGGLIGQNGIHVQRIVVVVTKHAQGLAQTQNQNLMAQIVVQMTLKHKFAITDLVQ